MVPQIPFSSKNLATRFFKVMKPVKTRFPHIFKWHQSVKQVGLQIQCNEEIIYVAPLAPTAIPQSYVKCVC